MKKYLRIALCFALMILAVSMVRTTSAEAATKFKNGKKNSVSVAAGKSKKYSIKLTEYSLYKLTTSASYDDRMNISIKIEDAKGKEMLTDSGKWSQNKDNDKLYDLTMEKYLAPGTYYITFTLDKGSPKWSHKVLSKITKFKALSTSKKTSVTLEKGETKYYKVTASESGHFLFTTSSKSSYDIDFYLLDANGEEIDDDDTNPDWTFDEAAGKKTMNWHTIDTTKGTYYLKIVNKAGSKQTIKVGTAYKTDAIKTSYAWVLVDTQIDVEDNYRRDDGMYIDNYEAYENKHIHYTEAHYSAKDNRYGKTEATCTTPPTVIYNKEEIKLHLTIEISGTRGSDTVHVRPEDPEINYGSTTGRGKFATKDDKHSLDVYIDDSVKRYEDDVYGTLPDGSAGDRIALFFCGCGADTKWIYEYKLVE